MAITTQRSFLFLIITFGCCCGAYMNSVRSSHIPVFDEARCQAKVVEGAAVKTKVETVANFLAMVYNADANGNISYKMVTSSDSEYFKINEKNGIIKVAKQIDRQPNEFYEIRIRAYNGMIQSAEVDVKICVIDRMARRPIIMPMSKQPIYLHESFEEYNQPILILQINSNIPSNPHYFAKLLIVLPEQTNSKSTFIIEQNNNTVLLKLRGRLDYETVNEFALTLFVENVYGIESKWEIRINVVDNNDNFPVFSGSNTGSIPENAPPGTFVMQVKAYDSDGTTANNIVSYRFEEENQTQFHIDSQTGIITSLKCFDREYYVLQVIAEDNSPSILLQNGKPNRVMQTVIITITDKNGNPLIFKKSYDVDVPESTEIGKAILNTSAVDPDISSVQTDNEAIVQSLRSLVFLLSFLTFLLLPMCIGVCWCINRGRCVTRHDVSLR